MPHALLVDDDATLLEALSLLLEDNAYRVTTARDGQEAFEIAQRDKPDMIISDVNMPKLDGFALCKRLRERGVEAPIILLTSRDTEIDEALGLELGADDYITKPFSNRVLLARIAALLRRNFHRNGKRDHAAHVVVGKLDLDAECLEVRYAGELITFTLTEFRILEALAGRPGIVLSRARLLEIVRGDDSVVADRIIDTYVRRLRKRLEAVDPNFAELETVIGAGYRWRR
ncbi:MAG: response regulator transcription factor [Polyangiaceae bacterium]